MNKASTSPYWHRSRQVSFGLIDHLCSGYGVDPGVTALVDSAEFFIVPTFNPDVIGTGDGSDGFETNLNGVNLYTHFPNPVNMDDDGDFREREIYNMVTRQCRMGRVFGRGGE